MITTWPPGPLLRPPCIEDLGELIFSAPCTCNWLPSNCFANAEMEEIIASVSIYQTALVFSDEDGSPILCKPICFMGESRIQAFKEKPIFIINKCRNIHDDLAFVLCFKTDQDGNSFARVLEALEVPSSLETKIYILEETPDDDPTARLLKGSPALRRTVTDVFTALAYSESAEVLAPLVAWDVKTKSHLERKVLVSTVNRHFQDNPPPLLLILNSAASVGMRSLPESIYWDDNADKSIEFVPSLHLPSPSPPKWHGHRPPPESWVDFQIQNYGIDFRHHPDVVAGPRCFIAISYELVDAFSAACAACNNDDSKTGASPEAQESLEAATASLKMSLVHAVSHLWVSEHGQSSPPKADVRGASKALLDAAEDKQNPDNIEAGLLVQSCWLGRPHELVITESGWFRFALREATEDAPLVPRPDPVAAAPEVNSDDDLPLATMRLGSFDHRSPSTQTESPTDHDDLVEAKAISVHICDPNLVSRFSSNPLPLFPPGAFLAGGVSLPVTPSRRNKDRLCRPPALRTPSPASMPSQRPPAVLETPPRPLGMLAGSTRVVAIRSSKGPKWPAVQYPRGATEEKGQGG